LLLFKNCLHLRLNGLCVVVGMLLFFIVFVFLCVFFVVNCFKGIDQEVAVEGKLIFEFKNREFCALWQAVNCWRELQADIVMIVKDIFVYIFRRTG